MRRNLRLVLSEALRHRWQGVPLADLVQAGNEALVRAAELYDPAKGYRFSTYAMWWIRQGVQRGLIEMGRVIRAPHTEVKLCWRVRGVLEREPGLGEEQLAEAVGVELADLRYALAMNEPTLSLDYVSMTQDEPDRRPFWESVMAEDGETAHDQALAGLLRDDLEDALADLPLRMRTAVSEYYLREDPPTLRQLGKRIGLSGERTRQVIREGLQRLAKHRALRAWR